MAWRQDAHIAKIRTGDNGIQGGIQKFTASGTLAKFQSGVDLDHASVAADVVVDNAANHQGLFIISNNSSGGTASHTVTLTSGTFNNTGNNKATLNAPAEALVVYFDGDGGGQVLLNAGAVALSTV
jgi:hypothetical protein